MKPAFMRRLIAEAVGTAMLVLVGAGSVVAALTASGGELGYDGLGFIALAFAIVIALVIYGFGPVSGAHINPVVTLSLAVTRRFPWSEVVGYISAQLVGAVIGALLIVAAFGTSAVDLGLGATALSDGVSYSQGIVAEMLGTFVLLFAVMALAVDSRAPVGWAGLMIGLSVAAAILLIGPLTGGSLNPARTFGPYLALSFFGGSVEWPQIALYTAGPLLGGIAAVLAYDFISKSKRAEMDAVDESYTPSTQTDS